MEFIKADLHIHSTFSDGLFTPSDLVDIYHKKNIKIISLTDHDTIDGFLNLPIQNKLSVIPGIEISCSLLNNDFHILSYFFDIKNPNFNLFLHKIKNNRLNRAEQILAKLSHFGIQISIDELLAFVKHETIGRKHIADYLKMKKYVSSYQEAFYKYIGDNSPILVKGGFIQIETVIEQIHSANGITVLAHPGKLDEQIIEQVINLGISGLEIIHPSHKPEEIRKLKQFVKKYDLIRTGGTDFHGINFMEKRNIGNYFISNNELEKLNYFYPDFFNNF